MFGGIQKAGLKALPPHKILESAHHVAPLLQAHHFNLLVGPWAPKGVSTVVNSVNESTKSESIH